MNKGLIGIFALFLSLAGSLSAEANGNGFDVVSGIPVADPDAVSDEGAYGLDLLGSIGGERTSYSINVKYQLYKMSKRSNLTFNFLAYQYEWSNSVAGVDGQELQFNLYYSRNIFKNNLNDFGEISWRPSKWSLSYYAGLGFASSSLDVTIANLPGQPAVTELNGLRGGTNFVGEVDSVAVPINFGLVGNVGLSRRLGFEAFANVDQHIEIDDPAFGSYQPTLTVGGIFHFKSNARGYFPMEYSLGLILNSATNDIDDDSFGANALLGIRKRF
jgi:hypothetical protein